MSELKQRIAAIDNEIAVAKKAKQAHKRRIKIIKSYKGDPTNEEALLKVAKRGLTASEASKEMLEVQLDAQTEKQQEAES